MKNMRRGAILAGRLLVIGLLCGTLVIPQAWAFLASSGQPSRDGATSIAGRRNAKFSISGKVRGMYPGRKARVRTTLTNPNKFKIKVKVVSAVAKKSNTLGCGKKWLRPKKSLKVRKVIRKGKKIVVWYPVLLAKGAPNNCQKAKWPLKFYGSAVKV